MKRKHLIIAVLAWLVGATAWAQNSPTVERMTETTDFIPANDKRTDLNGVVAALVKVQVLDEISGVEGTPPIGDIVSRGVEKWVYMPQGSKHMTVYFKNNLPLRIRFSDHDITSLKSNRVYELVIHVPNMVTQATPQTQPQTQTQTQPQTQTDDRQRQEQQRAEQAQRQREEEQRRREEEAQRKAEEKAKQQAQREQQAEQRRLKEQQETEQRRQKEQQQAEERRQKELQQAEQRRQKEERQAEERRQKELQQAEERRKKELQQTELRRQREQQRAEKKKQRQAWLAAKDQQPLVLGIIVGPSMATAQMSSDGNPSTKSVTAFHVGMTAEVLMTSNFYFNTGLIYSAKGYEYENSSHGIKEKGAVQFLDIPLLASLRLPVGGSTKLQLNAGPYLALCLGGKAEDTSGYDRYNESFSSAYSGFDYGLQAGLGFDFSHSIHLGLAYQLGTGSSYQNRNLMLSLGYRF